MFSRPSRIEIDLDKLERNIEAIRSHIPESTKIIAIVKSNAYSMGDVEIVRHLIEIGVSNFAVAATSEGIRIRREFKKCRNISIRIYTRISIRKFNKK